MNTRNERGMALVLALFLMSVMTVLGTSLMFLSQTETYATMNYRMMSQARYAAEAGIQKASNFLLDSTQYTVPGSGADPLSNYDRTVSPVTYNGHPVILSGTSAQASNYPIAAVQTAFNAAVNGSMTVSNAALTYTSYAELTAMQRFDSYGGGQAVVQTWQITGTGGLSGGTRKATVEVVALVETPKVAASSYAAFATDNTCGALNFDGNVTIDSYDSTNLSGATAPSVSSSGGNVGTNGNLTISGSVDVLGNLYTPRTGVGSCSANAVDALTTIGHANVAGSIVQLPTAVSYPTPPVPAVSPLAATGSINSAAGACALLGLTAANCAESGSNITIDGHGSTLSLPYVTLGSHTNMILVASSPPAQYNFNAIKLDGGSELKISATSQTQGVLVDVVGKNPDNSAIATPIDFVGGTFASVAGCVSCSNFDASMLQFVYAGTGEIDLTGNSGSATTVYAPNALVVFSGTADLYGSVLGNRIHNVGSGNIHYDRRLRHDFWVAGHPMVASFSWKRS
jgi:Tfp pilus assembly protein PilX